MSLNQSFSMEEIAGLDAQNFVADGSMPSQESSLRVNDGQPLNARTTSTDHGLVVDSSPRDTSSGKRKSLADNINITGNTGGKKKHKKLAKNKNSAKRKTRSRVKDKSMEVSPPEKIAPPPSDDFSNALDEEEDEDAGSGLDDIIGDLDESEIRYTIGDAMYLIVRNKLGIEDSKKFVSLISQLDNSVWTDVTRCFIKGKYGFSGIVRDNVVNMNPVKFSAIEGSLQTDDGRKLLNYPMLLKSLLNLTPYLTYKEGNYYYKDIKLFTLRDTAYEITYLERNLLATKFKIYAPEDLEYTTFRIAMVFCSNGYFSVTEDNNVIYNLVRYDTGDEESYVKFISSSKLERLRIKCLEQYANDILRRNHVSTVSYEMFSYFKDWKYLDNWSRLVDQAFKVSKLDTSKKDVMLKISSNVGMYSQYNKDKRRLFNNNQSFFIQTPEFDYYDRKYNFMTRRLRKTMLRADLSTDSKANNAKQQYDWTGKSVSKVHECEIGRFKSIMFEYTGKSDWMTKLKAAGYAIKVKYEQKHSMNIIVSQGKNKATAANIAKPWYRSAVSIREGEDQYMLNCIKGSFPFSGEIDTQYSPQCEDDITDEFSAIDLEDDDEEIFVELNSSEEIESDEEEDIEPQSDQ
jgi:hypothetical protein